MKRSIPQRTVRQLLSDPTITADLVCVNPRCCPDGRQALLADPREHALTSRLQALHELAQPMQPAWRWNILTQQSAAGLDLAQRINAVAGQVPDMWKINTSALRAIHTVAENRRQTLGRRRAA